MSDINMSSTTPDPELAVDELSLDSALMPPPPQPDSDRGPKRPTSSLKASSKKRIKPTPVKGKAAKKTKDDVYNEVRRLLGPAKSPLYKQESNIPAILQNPVAQSTLASTADGYQFEDVSSEDLVRATAEFKIDGASGRHDAVWLQEAIEASGRRDAGDFDAVINDKFQITWGSDSEDLSDGDDETTEGAQVAEDQDEDAEGEDAKGKQLPKVDADEHMVDYGNHPRPDDDDDDENQPRTATCGKLSNGSFVGHSESSYPSAPDSGRTQNGMGGGRFQADSTNDDSPLAYPDSERENNPWDGFNRENIEYGQSGLDSGYPAIMGEDNEHDQRGPESGYPAFVGGEAPQLTSPNRITSFAARVQSPGGITRNRKMALGPDVPCPPKGQIIAVVSDAKFESLFKDHYHINAMIIPGDILLLELDGASKEAKVLDYYGVNRPAGKPSFVRISIPPGHYAKSEPHLREDIVFPNSQLRAPLSGPMKILDAMRSCNPALSYLCLQASWTTFSVVRDGVTLGTLKDVRQAWQMAKNEKDYQDQLLFDIGRRRRLHKDQLEEGYALIHNILFRKIRVDDFHLHNKDLIVDLGPTRNALLALCTSPGCMIVMCDNRMLINDGIPQPHGISLDEAYIYGPNAFRSQYLREKASSHNWSHGHAHIGPLGLGKGWSSRQWNKGRAVGNTESIGYFEPSDNTWFHLKDVPKDAAPPGLPFDAEHEKVSSFLREYVFGQIRHYPTPRHLSGRDFGVCTHQYRIKQESERIPGVDSFNWSNWEIDPEVTDGTFALPPLPSHPEVNRAFNATQGESSVVPMTYPADSAGGNNLINPLSAQQLIVQEDSKSTFSTFNAYHIPTSHSPPYYGYTAPVSDPGPWRGYPGHGSHPGPSFNAVPTPSIADIDARYGTKFTENCISSRTKLWTQTGSCENEVSGHNQALAHNVDYVIDPSLRLDSSVNSCTPTSSNPGISVLSALTPRSSIREELEEAVQQALNSILQKQQDQKRKADHSASQNQVLRHTGTVSQRQHPINQTVGSSMSRLQQPIDNFASVGGIPDAYCNGPTTPTTHLPQTQRISKRSMATDSNLESESLYPDDTGYHRQK